MHTDFKKLIHNRRKDDQTTIVSHDLTT